jgi:subtilisin family serine protease
MRRVAPLFLTGLVALAACSDDLTPVAPTAVPAFNESASDGSDTYLVRFKGNGVPAGFATKVAALGGEVIFAHAVGVAAVSGLNDATAAQLALDGTIAAVDADMETQLPQADVATLEGADMAPESPTAPATSVRYPRQWHMQVIEAKKAWDAGKLGSPSVKVGILDSGLDYLHPDLVGRVDLNLSRSFLSAAENARVQTAWPGAHPIADLHYHGTHVGSTVVSNAYISSGVSSKVTLVGLKACTPGTAANGFSGTCPTSGSLAAILYAADNGVNIINMSIGGSTTRRNLSAAGGFGPSLIATINKVFNYAHGKGTTIVVSAGNSAIDLDHDGNGYKTFCSVPTVICVSATGPTSAVTINGPWNNIDALASYSNYGRSAISVAGPGGNGVSVTAACSGFTVVTSLLPCRGRSFTSPTSWSGFSVGISGTSMATPHVTGLAALLASDGVTQPAQIRARIQQSADDLGEPGTDPAYGKGRINVARAFGL